MKLTRTNRIIIVVTGLFVLLILICPPYQREAFGYLGVEARPWEYCGHRLIGPKPPSHYRYQIDGGQLALEVAIFVVLAGVLMVLLHKNPKPKPGPDKDE